MPNTFSSDAESVRVETTAGKKSRFWLFGIFILVITVGLVFILAKMRINTRESELEAQQKTSQETFVSTRADALGVWMQVVLDDAARVSKADLFRVAGYVVESMDGDISVFVTPPAPGDPMLEEKNENINIGDTIKNIPYTRSVLSDLRKQYSFISGRLISTKLETYLADVQSPPRLNLAQTDLAKQSLDLNKTVVSPIYILDDDLVVDIFTLVQSPDALQDKSRNAVSILMLTRSVSHKLKEVLAANPLFQQVANAKLAQASPQGFQEVIPGSINMLKSIKEFPLDESNNMPFGARSSLDTQSTSSAKVYSTGLKVQGLDWWVWQEKSFADVREGLKSYSNAVYLESGLITLVLILLLGLVWWRIMGREQKEIADRFCVLYEVIDEQKKLLDGINSAMTDPMSLTDYNGVFKYVNNAFADVVKRPAEELLGLDMAAVFGFDTARRLEKVDQHVFTTKESQTVDETIWLRSKRHNFLISKAPLLSSADMEDSQEAESHEKEKSVQGIVSLFRDITQMVDAQERNRRVIQQTIDVLVGAIEEVDPFLGGHSRFMGALAALITKNMHLTEEDAATVQAAAALSQVGKMFIPREILTKPGALTPEEKLQMEKHVEYTKDLIKDIDFGLPVLDAIYEMNERLDGQGYPQGLSGNEINIYARILSVANAFVAMARPRSYRDALPKEVIFEQLHNENNYDQGVVDALEHIIDTPAGERLFAQIKSAKAV